MNCLHQQYFHSAFTLPTLIDYDQRYNFWHDFLPKKPSVQRMVMLFMLTPWKHNYSSWHKN